MSDTEENNLTIEQKHRKERKKLQAEIQSLKKTAAKSDKKRKKEILEDILRLETELDCRQLEELNINKSQALAIGEILKPDEGAAPRISKAQKRRDKKAAEDKAREKMILEQELENINGPRNLEMRAIKKLLIERHLTLHIIPSNGDCLYGAIAHQLTVTGKSCVSVANLRRLTADYIRKHKEDYILFLSDADSGDMLTDDQFIEYCENVANTTTWGGEVELQALSALLKCSIQVLQSTVPLVIVHGQEYEGKPLVITYHRYMYRLGEHYNSTQFSDIASGENDELENSIV